METRRGGNQGGETQVCTHTHTLKHTPSDDEGVDENCKHEKEAQLVEHRLGSEKKPHECNRHDNACNQPPRTTD